MIKIRNKKRNKGVTTAPVHYERINFLKDFKNKGYVKKVLCLYEGKGLSDVVYYNNRERTEIPCIDKEILIVSDYDDGIKTYSLVQTDFSNPLKYKILMSKDTVDCSYPKDELYKYIREEKLVTVKTGEPETKQPQIDFAYGTMLLEIIEYLNESSGNRIVYQEKELNELIVKNVRFSKKFVEFENEFKRKETAIIRFNGRVMTYVDLIYHHSDKEELNVQQVLHVVRKYQNNYHYNL